MKARRVKGLDAAAPLGDNAERIVRTRLDELWSFMPRAADPAEVEALHDMRIAAKRLRYVLEVTHPVFGPFAAAAVDAVKDLQDLLGDIHDCDVQLPETAAVLAGAIDADVAAVADGQAPPNAEIYAGLVGLGVSLRARRELLFTRFLRTWLGLERDGFRGRLEFAVGERPDAVGSIAP
jgi:hypothetical protein